MFQEVKIGNGQRDPRVDPRPGDIVAKQMAKGVGFREVTTREGRIVRYTWEGKGSGMRFADGLRVSSWAAWCDKAVVVRRVS